MPEAGGKTITTAVFLSLLGYDVQDVDTDFFTFGDHSLPAMGLTARLSRRFARQITPGQVMVASAVAKLATITDGEGDSTQRMGLETILPLHGGNSPTLFCFCSTSGFAWQFSVLSRYLDPQWLIIDIQSPRPHGPMQISANLDEAREAHLTTLLEQQPYGSYYLLGYSPGGTLAQGVTTRLRTRDEQAIFLGLLDTWPLETQGWQEREVNGLDPEVLAEVNREREAFLAAQQGGTSAKLFTTIEGNYADTVRLLTITYSVPFNGKATLFVAECMLQEGITPEQTWTPWIAGLDIHRQDYAHVGITSSVTFEKIGPIICVTLNRQIYIIYKPIITENNYGFIICLIYKFGGYFSEIE